MHPFLLPGNISKLPPSIRFTASAAANGSLADLDKIKELLEGIRSGENPPWAVYLLPVVFIYLDLARIPALETLDGAFDSLESVQGANLAVHVFSSLYRQGAVPHDAAPDLWPRVWGWMQFTQTYWDAIPGLHPTEKTDIWVLQCSIVGMLGANHSPTRDQIARTRGLRSMFARAWTILVGNPRGAVREAVQYVTILTQNIQAPGNLEEIFDGVDGDLSRLASTIVKQISRSITSTPWQLTVAGIASAVGFAQAIAADNVAWNSVVISQGIVASIVSAMDALQRYREHDVHATMGVCLMLLVRYLQVPPGYVCVAEALRAGLLRLLVSLGAECSDFEGPYVAFIFTLLDSILPSSLVSYAVLIAIRTPFKDVSGKEVLAESELFQEWDRFAALVRMRLQSLSDWEAKGSVSFRACDNMSCGRIDRKSAFKRCSSCQFTSYCSTACQTADWRAAHREECCDLHIARVTNPCQLPTRERNFMRALLHEDYDVSRPWILLRQLAFMREHPGTEFATVFDYTTNEDGDYIQVLPLSAVKTVSSARTPNVELSALWARAARSSGRMSVHVVYVADGRLMRPYIFPLRSSSSALYDGLRSLVKVEPEEGEEWVAMAHMRISALLRATDGTITEIH